jgi:hypothetical protein
MLETASEYSRWDYNRINKHKENLGLQIGWAVLLAVLAVDP